MITQRFLFKRVLPFFIVFIGSYYASYGQLNDSILNVLNHEIDIAETHYRHKEERIEIIKQQLQKTKDLNLEFSLTNTLFNEYITYQYDSAYIYATRTYKIANQLNNDSLSYVGMTNLLHAYIAGGLFKEGFERITSINTKQIPHELKSNYYWLCMRFYINLMYYNESGLFSSDYINQAIMYSDSTKMYLKPNTAEYEQMNAFGLKVKNVSLEIKIEKLHQILHNYKYSDINYAIIYILLAQEYKMIGDNEKAIYYSTLSAIYDIRGAVRQTTAKTFLGHYLYEQGNIMFASKCIKSSLEDANFYNARHRKMEVNSILPIIEYDKINIIQNQKEQLTLYLILLCVFISTLCVALVIIYKQNKILKVAQLSIQEQINEISLFNNMLEEANKQLKTSKKQLEESNDIKDMYIVQSLYGKSEYIDRFEYLINKVIRKVNSGQYNDLKNLYGEFNLKEERENMFSSFDKTFLILFPNFIEEYNSLFKSEDRVTLNENGSLSPELRIFALIRLGITDNERIANFLNFTVKTIYSYKSKVKSKAIIPREEFEYRIMHIKKV